MFLKETDIFTNDNWRNAVDFDLSTYYNVLSALSSDLRIVELKQEFTPVHELNQINELLQALESKLHSFSQFLPRLDRRRGLLNLGDFLQILFGTATVSDIDALHVF